MAEITEIRGDLEMFSETGTEGGYWAIQDERYIRYTIPKVPPFKGHPVSDLDVCRYGKILESMHESGERLDSARPGQIALHVVRWDDGEQELVETDNLRAKYFSYNGLRLLENGDELTVFEKVDPSEIAWKGVVKLVEHDEGIDRTLNHPFRLHHDQEGVDQNLWAHFFLSEYPGMLVRPSGFEERTPPEEDKTLQD